MTTHVERSIEVAVPVRTAYDQWTRFEEFPHFMSGVEEVRQVGDAMTHWIAQIAGVRREWDAEIVEQVPDEKVAWAATTGATNAGAVFFDEVGADRTRVRLTLEFEPEGLVERIGDVLDIVDRQAVADLDRFKEFIEKSQSPAAGGWRGTIEDGDVVSESTGQQTNAGGTADGVPDARTASHAGGTGDLSASARLGDAGTQPHGRRVAVAPARTAGCAPPARRASSSGTSRTRTSRPTTSSRGTSPNRDISGEGVVERDFANRDITERDIANRGVTE